MTEKDVGEKNDCVSDREVIAEIQRLADGDSAPSAREFDANAEYSAGLAFDRFGSYNAAVEAAGFEPNEYHEPIPEQELLDEIRRLSEDGEAPKISDLRSRGKHSSDTYYKRFGSWSDAVREAGFEPWDPGQKEIPPEDLLFDFNIGYEILGSWPSPREYGPLGEHSVRTVESRFGSWEAAIEAAKEFREEEWEPLPEDVLTGVSLDV